MKRKFWTVLLAFAAILCLCLGLASCGGKGSGGNSNTEQDSGSEEEPAEPLPHDHVYGADNLCTVCGDKWEYTEGLEFTPSADGQSFLVSGAGTAQGDIVIPFGYQGKFVTGIADSAFANGTLTGIELPSSVTFIGKNAFFGSHLTYVTIPATVTVIGDSAFGGCVLLITVNIADLAAWCNIQFANGTANPLSQAQHLVVGGEEVTELVIPKGVTKVSDYAFYGCDFLESIVIPDSVTVLGTLVFGDFTVTIVIRFEGTVEQWQELIEGLQLWESGQGNPVDCENGSIDKNGTVTPTPGGEGGGEGGEQGGGDTPGGEHTHTYSETWSYDEDSHWHAATCHPTERSDEAPHTYENGVCTECHYAHQNHTYENGVCTECHFAHQDHTYDNGVCTECGYVHQNHTYENGVCTECHFVHQDHTFEYSDKTEAGHKETCSVCGKSTTEGHSYTDGVCSKCDYEHVGHTFTEYSVKNEQGHTGACSVCGKSVTGGHTYENGRCTECDYEHVGHTFAEYSVKNEQGHTGTCSVCHKVVTEGHNYDNGKCKDCNYEHVGHTFTEYTEKTESGHTGTCSVCHKVVTGQHTYDAQYQCEECHYQHNHTFAEEWESSEEGHWHKATCHPEATSEVTEHSYVNGQCTECDYQHEDHTFTYSEKNEEGHTGTCSVCNKVITAGHNYDNGVCTECEYAHQNHTYEKGVCTECHYAHKDHTYGDDNTCSVCGAKKPPYTKSEDGTKIYFGEYPQTEVKESGLKGFLGMEAGANPTSGSAGKWTDYGYYISGSVRSYMWYIDVDYQGSRYRGVYFTSYRPYWMISRSSTSTSYQDDNGYNTNTVYWFKYEPIEWRILEQKDGTALLMANIILDSQQYYHEDSGTRTINGKTVYPNNYKESDIRAWLTETFYETAFDEYAQQIIETTAVDNSASTTESSSNKYACENIEDKVFLLSYQEILNTSYGFSSSSSTYDTARRLKSTDYAKSQGCWQSTDSSYGGNGWWWLRSPYYGRSYYASNVRYDGYASSGYDVGNAYGGVVPALRIRL